MSKCRETKSKILFGAVSQNFLYERYDANDITDTTTWSDIKKMYAESRKECNIQQATVERPRTKSEQFIAARQKVCKHANSDGDFDSNPGHTPQKRHILPGHTPPYPGSRRASYQQYTGTSVWHVLPYTILTALATSMMMPVLPQVKEDFFWKLGYCPDNVYENCRGVASKYTGIFDSIGNFFAFMFMAVIGRLSDSFGRKPVIILSAMTSSLPIFALLIFPNNLWWYFGAMIANKFLQSTMISIAYVADSYPPEVRAKMFGILSGVGGIGMAIMPVVGAKLKDYIPHLLFPIGSGLSGLGIIYSFFIKESLPKESRLPLTLRDLSPFRPLSLMLRHPLVAWLALIRLLNALPENGLVEASLYFLQDKLDFTRDWMSWLFFTTGLMIVFTQIIMLPFLLKVFSERFVMLVGLLANLIHMIGYTIAWARWVMIPVEVLAALSFLTSTAVNAVLSKHLSQEEQGFGLGTLTAVSGICSILGPIMFSFLYSHFRVPPISLPELPFYVGAGMLGIAIIIVLFILPIYLKVRRKSITSQTSQMEGVFYSKIEGDEYDTSRSK